VLFEEHHRGRSAFIIGNIQFNLYSVSIKKQGANRMLTWKILDILTKNFIDTWNRFNPKYSQIFRCVEQSLLTGIRTYMDYTLDMV